MESMGFFSQPIYLVMGETSSSRYDRGVQSQINHAFCYLFFRFLFAFPLNIIQDFSKPITNTSPFAMLNPAKQ
ncbi:hypothetical protein ABD76_09955 [Paenibacillus dendritiformis]|nr:hypothetical protein [Paenibacillus dendritiformis]